MDFQTEHLLIRDPILDDWVGVHEFLADPEVMRWIHLGPEPYSEEQSRAWISDLMFHNSVQPRLSHNSVIVVRETQHIAGWIGLGKPSQPGIGDISFGYALRQADWGKGYMTEAVQGLLEFAFTLLDANSVYAKCEIRNIGSYHVMEKAGMTRLKTYLEPRETLTEPLEMFLYTMSRDMWLMETSS